MISKERIASAKAAYDATFGGTNEHVVFADPDDNIVVGRRLNDGDYHPWNWLKVFADGAWEAGILWGGDVWERMGPASGDPDPARPPAEPGDEGTRK